MSVARRLLVLLPPLLLLVGAPAALARAPSPSPEPRPLRVVFLDALQPENPWRRELVGAMRAAANDLGIDLVDHAVGHWPGEILEQARQVVGGPDKPDYLLITLHRGIGPRLLEVAEQAGVPVFVINSGLLRADRARYGGPRQHFSHWLGQMLPDDAEAGRQLAVLLLEAARARGDAPVRLVALEGRMGDGSATLRAEGLRQALAESQDAELLQSVSASWRQDVARRKTFLLRRRYPELQAVWAANDNMAMGALQGLEDAGAGARVLVGGVDWTPAALEAVRDGRMVASLGGHFLEGAWALVLLHDYHQGRDFASETLEWRTHLLPLTRDTVDAWLRLRQGTDWEAFDFRAFSKAAHPGLARYDFFLARSGAVLLESLDLEKVLPRIASLCVGALADWCVIDLKEDGTVRRVGGAHVDGAKLPLLEEFQRRYPPGLGSRVPAMQAMDTGETVLVPRVSEEGLRAVCMDDAHCQLVRELGLRSLLTVPLVARGRALGAITFASAEPGRYGPAERSLAEELARRAAIAIDNARLYRRAEEAIRLRETFLSVAGHELRTPLLPLQLRLQSLLRRGRGGASLEPSVLLGEVAAVEWQTRRLGQLVDQFLDVSNLVAGNALELRRKRVDLCELVTGVLEGLQRQIEASGSTVVRELRCPAEGEWDPRRLETVVTGLVQNALKFGQGRPIDVRLVPGPGTVRLVVKDRGIGMSESEQTHIFDRFSRSVSELNYGGLGLGLGLYISRWVVEAHGGRISVESRPGEGATFTVELPA